MKRKLNKIQKMLLPGVLGVSGLVGWAAKSQASMLTESFNASIPSALTDWTGNLTFPQFNPAGNLTLTGVEVVINGAMTTTLTVTNTAGNSSSGKVQTEIQISITDPAGTAAFDPGDPFVPGLGYNTPQLDYKSTKFTYSLGAGNSTTSGLLTGNATTYDTGVLSTAPVLAEFTGSGNINLPAGTFTQTDLSNTGGNSNSSQVTDAGLTGTVTYTYIPEPGTVSLFSLGGVAALLHRRRRPEQA